MSRMLGHTDLCREASSCENAALGEYVIEPHVFDVKISVVDDDSCPVRILVVPETMSQDIYKVANSITLRYIWRITATTGSHYLSHAGHVKIAILSSLHTRLASVGFRMCCLLPNSI